MSIGKSIGVLVAFACFGVAGWRLNQYYNDTRKPETRRPGPSVVTPNPALPPLPPLKRPATLALASMPKYPTATLSDADWRAAYPVIVAGLERPSFATPIALPWRFGSTDPEARKEAPVAQAMAFLVTADLSWASNAYQVPPAFAVFRANADQEADVASYYEPSSIAERVKKFGGTHAIGGVLVRGDDGFVATLQIFDASGRAVHEVALERPQPVFELLGQVSVNALKFFGATPSETLAEYLRRERCRKPDSLTALGRIAFISSAANADVKAADAILDGDEGFAELRYWRALQKARRGGSLLEARVELQRSLGDAVLVQALSDLAQILPTRDMASRDPSAWLDRAESLGGLEHPDLMAVRLKHTAAKHVSPWSVALRHPEFAPYTKCAARHPHHARLIETVLWFQDTTPGETSLAPVDPELLASLALVRLFDPNQPTDTKADAWRQVARAAELLGRYDHVQEACRRMKEQPDAALLDVERRHLEAAALMQSGNFGDACDAFTRLMRHFGGTRRNWIAREAAICAVLAGRRDALESISLDPSAGKLSEPFLKEARKFLAGEVLDAPRSLPGELDGRDILLAECELAQGGDFNRNDRARIWHKWSQTHSDPPAGDRLRWFLLERYYRAQPSLANSAGFHEAAEWFRGNDPMVIDAVGAWRSRGPGPTPPAYDDLKSRVTATSSNDKPPVWQTVSQVRRDLQAGRLAQATAMRTEIQSAHYESTWIAWVSRQVDRAEANAVRQNAK